MTQGILTHEQGTLDMDSATVQRISQELEAERDRQGLTYYALAKLTGYQYRQGNITKILRGEANPSLAIVAEIAEALGKRIVLQKL